MVLVAILYSQPTVAPIVIVVKPSSRVVKYNLGNLPVFLNKSLVNLYHEVPACWVYFTPLATTVAFSHGVLSNTNALSELAANSMVSVECTLTYISSTREEAKTL